MVVWTIVTSFPPLILEWTQPRTSWLEPLGSTRRTTPLIVRNATAPQPQVMRKLRHARHTPATSRYWTAMPSAERTARHPR